MVASFFNMWVHARHSGECYIFGIQMSFSEQVCSQTEMGMSQFGLHKTQQGGLGSCRPQICKPFHFWISYGDPNAPADV